jgi:hypothetical protein
LLGCLGHNAGHEQNARDGQQSHCEDPREVPEDHPEKYAAEHAMRLFK